MLSARQAEEIIGGLSRTSKMPGLSWSISAEECKTGAVLRKVPGSVCEGCYALKGRYRMPNVTAALDRRLQALSDPRWVEAMVIALKHRVSTRCPFFRWFDSGDLQGLRHLRKILKVCEATPDIWHWLPTREDKIVSRQARTISIPNNLVIRVSAPMVHTHADVAPLGSGLSSSVMVTSLENWRQLVDQNDHTVHHCPAPLQENKCGDCRACWDDGIRHVIYKKH